MSAKSGARGIQPGKPLWKSIKLKTLLLVLLMVSLLVLLGIAGTLYYQGVIRQNIHDDALNDAKTIAATTNEYMNTSQLYLQSVADRPLVVDAIEENNLPFLHSTAVYANQTNRISSVFFTDSKGTIIESTPGIASLIGSNSSDGTYVDSVLQTGDPVIGDLEPGMDRMPVVYIYVPVKGNGTVIGVMAGSVDLDEYYKMVVETILKPQQIFYMVNKTGHVMLHTNQEYATTMRDFTAVPGVQHVLRGETGVADYYDPIENQSQLVAYTPVGQKGWGVIVALPADVAYKPVWNATLMAATIIVLFSLIATGLGWYIGNGITAPITSMSQAARIAFKTDDYRKMLPLGRKDEIGDLARSFSGMVDTIKREERERELAAEELRDAKAQAELYLDLMGHDINNMHQIALGYLELARDIPACEEQTDSLNKSIEVLHRSALLIQNVRKLQNIRKGLIPTKEVDVCKVLSDIQREFGAVPNKSVTLNLNGCEHCFVLANELLHDVFANLVTNAIKHTGDHADIFINLQPVKEKNRSYCRVSVEDNGPGIPDDNKGTIFNRALKSTSKAKGMGLGLYLVKSLVDSYNGRVWVEDRVPGEYRKGVRFVVMLPAIEK